MTGRGSAPRSAGALDPAGAFVVRFRVGSHADGPVQGRIEHVATGRESRFESVEELAEFMLGMLPAAKNTVPDPGS